MVYFQIITFALLALVSSFFTFNLASEVGSTGVERLAIIAGSLVIECVKLFALIAANQVSTVGVKKRPTGKLVFLYTSYGFLATYSVLASFGYALSTVERMEARTRLVDKTEHIEAQKRNLDGIEESLKVLQKGLFDKQLTLGDPEQPQWRRNEVSKTIAEDRKALDEYRKQRAEIQKDIEDSRDAMDRDRREHKRDMYTVIGDTVKVKARYVAFAVLFVFALAIELGIFVTSPHGVKDKRKKLQEA